MRPIKLTVCFIILIISTPSWAAGVNDVNNGQDFTRPVYRLEGLLKYDDMAGDSWSTTMTLRAGAPFPLGGGWAVSLRADLPYRWTSGISPDNPAGVSESGFSDTLTQALFIAPSSGKWTYAVGTQFILPTAEKDELGKRRYQLVPSAGFKYDLSGWMQGAWAAFMARQAFNITTNSNRPDIRVTYIQPILNIDLPDLWFLTFAPEALYDWKKKDWFVPFDITAGKMLTREVVASIEYKSAIRDDLKLFVNEVEARIGFFF